MKKALLVAAVLFGAATVQAQDALQVSKFWDNWSIGLFGGGTTPLKHAAFWGDMRGMVGLDINKQITPVFGMGVEGAWAVNTSSWKRFYPYKSSTAFDRQYVGLYGAVNLNNLFAGYNGARRVFEVEVVAGAGWGHEFFHSNQVPSCKDMGDGDHNYFATKVGLNLNFNLGSQRNWTIAIKPSIGWDMTDNDIEYTSAGYNANMASVQLLAGVTYHFGQGFKKVRAYDQAEIDALNDQINALRGDLDACNAALNNCNASNAALQKELEACKNREPEKVVTVVDNSELQLNTVRYVFFKVGKSNVTADQMPNIEQVASYLKNHPNAKVVVKGYASPEGSEELNIRLANQRAESVKTALVKKYNVAADRVSAEGQGIGKMFSEQSWNRVSICTIEDK